MVTIVTRAVKGSALTHVEVDANFNNLNTATLSPIRHSVRPSLLLDFANTRQLDPRITFTRASTATYYDGQTTAKAEENLVTSSQVFSATWSLNNMGTITDNSIVAPDGTTTAGSISNGVLLGSHGIYKTISTAIGATFSFYAKAGTSQYVGVNPNVGTACYAVFDLTGGTVTASAGGTASIVSIGSGWYRCILANTTATGAYFIIDPVLTSTTVPYSSYTATNQQVYIWGAQLEQRNSVTAYTPTTTAPITNYIPVLQTAASGVARFDHNPTTSESLGLLIEEQRVNLSTYSEQFDNAAWNKANATITANTIIAPDGTLTGDKLIETTANNFHFISPASSGTTVSTTYTASIYVKAAERTWFVLTAFGVPGTDTWFNLSTGVSGTTGGNVVSKSITLVGNGWYKCSITYVATSTNNGVSVLPATANGTSVYTGDGYSGIYIWGAQLEAGAFATSYIPTVASQVTRLADTASMTGTNFSSWYRADEGTLYAENALLGTSSLSSYTAMISNGSSIQYNYAIIDSYSSSNGRARVLGYSQTTIDIDLYPTGTVANSVYSKLALAIKLNDYAFSKNGATASSDTSGGVPVVSQLTIGGLTASTANQLNGTIKKIAYYPLRLTNAELQGLTSQ